MDELAQGHTYIVFKPRQSDSEVHHFNQTSYCLNESTLHGALREGKEDERRYRDGEEVPPW